MDEKFQENIAPQEPQSTQKPKIIWEKWVDPFDDAASEGEWNQWDDDDDSEASRIFEEQIQQNKPKSVRVISTPMGLIPYNEYTASSKIFNFWVGHTNFNISEGIVDIIKECNGVEILDPFTRYRFRLAVAKCFDESDVKLEIQNKTAQHLLENQNQNL